MLQLDPSVAVAQRIGMDADSIQKTEQQIGHRLLPAEHKMTVSFDPAVASAYNKKRKVCVRMRVRITEPGAV